MLLFFSSVLILFLVGCANTTTSTIPTTTIEPTTTSTTVSIDVTETTDYDLLSDYQYGDDFINQTCDIYLPLNYKEMDDAKIILFIHGGAWVLGSKENYGSLVVDLTKHCFTTFDDCIVVNMNHRLSGFNDGAYTIYDMIEDITSCITKTTELLKSIGITATSVALGGHSAGGHLALLYSYRYQDESPIKVGFVFSLSGPTDIKLSLYQDSMDVLNEYIKNYIPNASFEGLLTHATGKDNIDDAEKELVYLSPINYVDSNTVPTIMVHGTNDEIVPYVNATDLNTKLEENKVTHLLISIDGASHNDTSSYTKLVENNFFKTFDSYVSDYL